MPIPSPMLVVVPSPVCADSELGLALVLVGLLLMVEGELGSWVADENEELGSRVADENEELGRRVVDKDADVEMILPFWSTVAFEMLKNELKASGVVLFT